MTRYLGLFLFILMIGACTAPPPVAPTPDFQFWTRNPIRLSVDRITTVDAEGRKIRERGDNVNINAQMAVGLDDAVKLWAKERLRASSRTDKQLIVQIDEQPEPEGRFDIRHIFQMEPDSRFIAKLRVTLIIAKANNKNDILSQARINIQRSRGVGQNSSMHERDRIWVELIETVADEMDQLASQALREKLGVIRSLPSRNNMNRNID